jgi:phosphate/sulfate permease
MGIPVSLILIAVGAILAFATNQQPGASVDIDVVGWILMIVGLAGLLLSLLLWERLGGGYWGSRRGPDPYGPGPPPPLP